MQGYLLAFDRKYAKPTVYSKCALQFNPPSQVSQNPHPAKQSFTFPFKPPYQEAQGLCPSTTRYTFPFLPSSILMQQPHSVAPLYHHLFPPAYAPTLSFVGLPWKTIPFPQCELQAAWVAHALAGACRLPSPSQMLEHAQQHTAKFSGPTER